MSPIEANIAGINRFFDTGFKGHVCDGIYLNVDGFGFSPSNRLLCSAYLDIDLSKAKVVEKKSFFGRNSRSFVLNQGEMLLSDGLYGEVVLRAVDECRRPIPLGESFLDRMKRRMLRENK